MSLIEKDNYDMNMPKPAEEVKQVDDNENSESEFNEDLKIEPMEKEDIFIKPKQKIINQPKTKKKREMSEKQKLHLQNLIKKNKERSLLKKEKLKKTIKKKQPVKKQPPLKKKQSTAPAPAQEQVGTNFVNDLRQVDKRPSKTDYYNDMEKMFGLFTRFQESQNKRNEEIIEKRVQAELQKRAPPKIKKISRQTSRYNIDEDFNDLQKKTKEKPISYNIDFTEFTQNRGYNRSNPYGF